MTDIEITKRGAGKVRPLFLFGVLLWAAWASHGWAASYQAEVEAVAGRAYFEKASELIRKAERSIYVVMYHMEYDPEVRESSRLLSDLAAAHDRGVAVQVVLDRDQSKREQRNERAFQFLNQKGIAVSYDDVETFTHAKVVIVDETWVLLGSHNWSERAFSRNREESVLIRSTELAKAVRRDLEESLKGPAVPADRVAVPKRFLEERRFFKGLVDSNDERGLRTYTWLLYRFGQEAEVSPSPRPSPLRGEGLLDPSPRRNGISAGLRMTEVGRGEGGIGRSLFSYEELAEELGLADRMDRVAYRREINRILERLERRGLVRFEAAFDKDGSLELLDLERCSGTGTNSTVCNSNGTIRTGTEDAFLVPKDFWGYGISREISLAGAAAYLVGCYCESFAGRSWQASGEWVERQFGIERGTFRKGIQELRRRGLVEVIYSETRWGFAEREATRYRLKPLVNPAQVEARWRELEGGYGAERVRRIRDYLKVVSSENDPDAVAKILEAVPEDGERTLAKAVALLGEKALDNPKRSLRYLIGTYERMRRRGE